MINKIKNRFFTYIINFYFDRITDIIKKDVSVENWMTYSYGHRGFMYYCDERLLKLRELSANNLDREQYLKVIGSIEEVKKMKFFVERIAKSVDTKQKENTTE